MASIVSVAGLNNGPVSQGNVTVETAFASVPAGTARGFVNVPAGVSTTQVQGRLMRLRAIVLVTGGTTTNYTFALRWSAVVPNAADLTTMTGDVSMCSTGAQPYNTVTHLAMLQADLMYDQVNARIHGYFNIMYDGATPAYTNWAILTTPATGVTNSTNLKFFATGIFSATNANNAAILTDLSLDLM